MSQFCPDCGYGYDGTLQEHWEVCIARICALCENTYPRPIPENAQGYRVCGICQLAGEDDTGLDSGEEESESE